MRKLRRIVLFVLAGFALLVISLVIYIHIVARIDLPRVDQSQAQVDERKQLGKTYYAVGNNRFRKSESGLFELYVEGSPYQRGVAITRITNIKQSDVEIHRRHDIPLRYRDSRGRRRS